MRASMSGRLFLIKSLHEDHHSDPRSSEILVAGPKSLGRSLSQLLVDTVDRLPEVARASRGREAGETDGLKA